MDFKLWLESWDRQSAEQYVQTIQPIWQQMGYSLHIVGSIAERGNSENDLDIVATQFRFLKDKDFILLDRFFGGEATPEHYDGPHAEQSNGWVYNLILPDGRVVDFYLVDSQEFGHI
jgi:hypothetical protein